MEFAGSPFDIKSLDDSGRIEGLLAGFGDVDMGGDRLLPGCLTKSLANRTTPLPMLLHHDLRRPIGAWKEWQERPEGLYVKGALTLASRDAQEAHALARDGALSGLSIGWKSKRADTDRQSGVRTIAEAELFEGSLVTIPLHERTRVSAVKSIAGAGDIAEVLREAGFSTRRAKHAAGIAWKALNDETHDAEATAISRLFEEHAARLAAF
jgi:uncharacterized protein